jgi:hypothetical protein
VVDISSKEKETKTATVKVIKAMIPKPYSTAYIKRKPLEQIKTENENIVGNIGRRGSG